ncbi:MAG: cation:dicarboxylase symporter family transporter [Phenylobacterium sp.]|uniref:dicarboxylate/amino acid:cation symporter n=1 Tax=Phenylobacterium sp. TaxID=1871053 RepID=UPI0027157060|nr:cation:dicarboxylase symporter family transporter [Phenylobacterium sp.]MDO8901207.1 cation:dicarboxylase symporter family transporter [Phenylobacterium sp.]MDP2212523.1 cation:dicarboxylase symporter family transporter [Phenylobacterium sp.]
MFRSLSVLVLAALVGGLVLGAAIHATESPVLTTGAETFEAVGALWLNALRMTIVPLVFSLLVTGVASAADAAATGRLAARSFMIFAAVLVVAALYGAGAMNGLLALWPIDPAGAAALTSAAQAGEVVATPTGFREWLPTLAPANPVRAAAEDAILQIVVFGLVFGFAVTRLRHDLRAPLIAFFRAISETMIIIVRWVLVAAPLGVFALALGIGLRTGLDAAGVLTQYVVMVSAVTIGVLIIPYALVAVLRGRDLGRFARACAPVQVLAFSTQSSLACLPAMVERTRDELGASARVTGVVLPLAVAVFRMTSPVANLAVAFFIVRLYGLEPGGGQIAAAIAVSLAVSVGAVGLPGQISFFASMAPICLALGAPLEILAILLAVEVIPDIFRTVGNITADMAVAAVVPEPAEAPEAEDPRIPPQASGVV